MPSAGLVGAYRRRRDQMDVGSQDAGAVVAENHCAVHLGQLGQPSWREVGVGQLEAAGANCVDRPSTPEDDQCPVPLLDDPLQTGAERGARGETLDRPLFA